MEFINNSNAAMQGTYRSGGGKRILRLPISLVGEVVGVVTWAIFWSCLKWINTLLIKRLESAGILSSAGKV